MTESGIWIFTPDQYHVYENHESSHSQGQLARDHDDWVRSNQVIHRLAKRTNAKVVFGHDKECLESFEKALMHIDRHVLYYADTFCITKPVEHVSRLTRTRLSDTRLLLDKNLRSGMLQCAFVL